MLFRSKSLVAAPPESLSYLFETEEKRLQEKKALVEKAIEEVRAMPSTSGYIAPIVNFIPQERIAQYFVQRNDVWNESLLEHDKTWWGFNDIQFIEQYGMNWLSWYWEHAPKDILVKIFSNDQKIERQLMEQMPKERTIRFWKGNHEFTGSLWIIGEYVVTVNVRQEPHYLVEMRDRILAQNLRTVFATLWEQET